MIKNLIFDMGRVLIEFDIRYYIAKYTDDPDDQALAEKEMFQSVEWIQLDRGVIEPEDAIASINRRLPERLHRCTEGIVSGWYDDIREIGGMYSLIENWKKRGYRVYLLSNTGRAFHRFRENIPALTLFDGELISADCHLLKPEHEIFELLCERFELDPAECVFIDDSPANVEGAIHAGMSGIIFRGKPAALDEALVRLTPPGN